MTRKRFIKILMSKGIQHNHAVLVAKEVREYGGVGFSYSVASRGIIEKLNGKDMYTMNLSAEETADYFIRRNTYISRTGLFVSQILKDLDGAKNKMENTEIFTPNSNEDNTYKWWLKAPGCEANEPTAVFAPGFVV